MTPSPFYASACTVRLLLKKEHTKLSLGFLTGYELSDDSDMEGGDAPRSRETEVSLLFSFPGFRARALKLYPSPLSDGCSGYPPPGSAYSRHPRHLFL